ncbi:MAG: homocysteine S-methyltransferase family protein [Chloroflexi bacterium]|nr:homocysteine S-methyltransferase family protein [Chloroflexota bacterium]
MTLPQTTTRTYTNRRYLNAIADHIVIFDGAMGTSIQKFNLTAADFGGERYNGCNDYLVITRPDVIEAIHASFLAVGSEAVETDTFRGNRLTLAEYGLGDRVLEINRAAAQIARRVCDRFEAETGIPRFVAGSIGPSGKLPSGSDPDLSNITFEELADVFYEQARGLVEGGADLLLVETSQDILEVKAAVVGINRYFEDTGVRIPLQCQVTLDTTGRMLFGTDIASALATLEALPIDVIGMNCSTGPEYMRAPIQYLVEHSRLPISVLPNAGLPINVDGEAVYPMEPEPFSDMVAEFARWGVNVVGGCCGTRPEHLDALYRKVHGHSYEEHLAMIRRAGSETLPYILPDDGKDMKKVAPKARDPQHEAAASSGMTATLMQQNPGPTLIGERVNSQGSRKVKQLLLADDYDSIVQIAVDQVDSGAHMLDVCVALTERADEKEMMQALVKKLSMAVSAPLIFDTTEADVAEAALALYPGRGIINGNNLENGRERIDKILPIAKKYGAAVISMTIDEEGMAHSRERKYAIARRIHDIAVNEYGLKPEDLIFDTLVFTLTTGQEELRNSAIETIESIRLIKQNLPGVLTSLGVSNVSFGVKPAARGVLNSVFLYHAVQAGLDMAIVNPAHITPYAEIPEEQRKLADDLIFNTDPDALPRFIHYFEQNAVAAAGKETEDPTANMTGEQALHWQIVHRKKDGVEALINDCLTRQDAVGVLNNVLLPAMKEVGDKFGAGELILPFVLQSAEVMKKSVAYLETFMDKVEGSTKGVVVLATVYGDVHDIGKNLVKTILSNNGYTVHDLGKQVPANTIIEKAQEYQADAIGLSALLVSTSKQMPLIVNELARRGLSYPVLIGGAAINRKFGRRILFLEETNQPYHPGVFYCKDAFEGLSVMDKLTDAQERGDFVGQIIAEAFEEMGKTAPAKRAVTRRAGTRTVRPAPSIPTPPFWGTKTIHDMPLEIVFKYLHKPELFRLSWGAKNTQGAEWAKLEAAFEARLAQMQKDALRDKTLRPQAAYGYFPCNSQGDDLIVWDWRPFTEDGAGARALTELARFTFPRQPGGEHLCLSDYFAPVESGQVDTVALQVVTVGAAATEAFDKLQAANEYSEAYFFHGLAVQTAEAAANFVNRQVVNKELGIPPGQGKRYSWGYPACPDLRDHQTVFKLLPGAAADLGLSLTASYQLVPEQSTAAIVVHHPDAKYYSVGSLDRTAQILGE